MDLGTTTTSPELRTVAAPGAVTPDQLRITAEAMLQTMATILDQREEAQREEMGYLLRAFYERIRDEEETRYGELRDQIHGVGLGLLAEQTRTSARLDAIVGAGATSRPKDQPDDDEPSRDAKRP